MSKRLCFLIYPVLVLFLSSVSFGEPGNIRLDFDESGDVNTQPGFTSFLLTDSGKTINGITIYVSGNINDSRRSNPSDPEYPIPYGEIYRDFVYGVQPSGVTIKLFGLGANQSCKINLYAYDVNSEPTRAANWYSNGTFIFTADFNGGMLNWPDDITDYNNTATVTADGYGGIILTSTRNPISPTNVPFAVVNALLVTPQGTYIQPDYATNPQPADDKTGVSVDVVLAWTGGGHSVTRDVYFGTDEAKVTDANRSNPLGVLVSENQSTTTYTPPDLLDLNKNYYWRIDEVNGPTIWKGTVWSFTTSLTFVIEDFDSYEDNDALRDIWKDYTANGTGAEVSVEMAAVRDGKSMRYQFNNDLSPYYSEAYADITDLGIDDPNLLGIGAKTLVLYFYGEPANPYTEQMYVKLTDGESPANTATVLYSNMNDVRLKQWNKWSVALTAFTGVNLANVSRITIGFGDGSPGNAGVVYIEDITLDYAQFAALPAATSVVDVNTIYQELEGFGAAGAWHEFEIPMMQEADREGFYNILFGELGLDIYRIRNVYDQGNNSYIDNTAQIVAAGKARNPSLKIMISGWSPPVYLKSGGSLIGGTLKKDPSDPNASAPYYYKYSAFAQWWADSLVDFNNHGVVADYINIQNETDFIGTWDTCRFNATEGTTYAGYNKAFEAVYQKLYSQMGTNMPKMLAPETAGFSGLSTYITSLIDRNHVYGYAHHLYNGGGNYRNADGYITSMTTLYNNNKNSYGNKPLMQTEFAKGIEGSSVTTFPEAMNLARLMHNALVVESASAYLYWELFWTPPNGLVMYGMPYAINPVYYAFKQYAAFTDPGWHRIGASNSLGGTGNLRISAFKSPNGKELTIVIINISNSNYNLTLDLNWFSPVSSEIYRTSATENTVYIGPFLEGNSLMMPAQSITTIHSPVLSNCTGFLAAGFGLTSDIDPDCYVNYRDLKIITDYWLNIECDLYGDCEGADFEPTDGVVNFLDLSKFAQQWLWCNAPEDPDCI